MIESRKIYALTKDTQHLPPSSFYLGCADILTEEAKKVLQKKSREYERDAILQEIENNLYYALTLFAKDKNTYTLSQKEWFIKKKYIVDTTLKALQLKHIKMLFNELKVI